MAGRDDWMSMTGGGSRTSAYSGETDAEKKKRLEEEERKRKAQSTASKMDRGEALTIRKGK